MAGQFGMLVEVDSFQTARGTERRTLFVSPVYARSSLGVNRKDEKD